MAPITLRKHVTAGVTDVEIVIPAIGEAFAKLDPRLMIRNPVMFAVEIVAALATLLMVRDLIDGSGWQHGFAIQVVAWLWFTVVFANFAEAVAEGRGKAQAETLRRAKTDTEAKLIGDAAAWTMVAATSLKPGDVVLVEAGDIIPSDGEVIEGVASVNEAAITGESAPVIRESGGDRSAVTGGTEVISDWLKVRITAAQG
jgi:K+-transporting ATPase ATPase B chain